MFIFTSSIRPPKKSEMTLSNQVKESIDGAADCLRDALAFAARTEHPITITTISDILCRLESLEQVDDLMQHFARRGEENSGTYRGWTPRKILLSTLNIDSWTTKELGGEC